MLTSKTSANIRMGRHAKGLHACRHSTGAALLHVETQRLRREEDALSKARHRRRWLIVQWNRRCHRGAARLRVLPPSVRRTGEPN